VELIVPVDRDISVCKMTGYRLECWG